MEELRAIATGESVDEVLTVWVGEEIGELIAVVEEAVGLAGGIGVAPPAPPEAVPVAFLTTCDP